MSTERTHDLAVKQLFSAREWAMISGAVLMLLVTVARRNTLAQSVALILLLCVFLISTLATWYYIFRITRSLHSTGYALGHAALAIALTPIFLLGVILVPLLVRGDAERLGQVPDSDSDDTI